jgi:adenine phosphoribosyltransferase
MFNWQRMNLKEYIRSIPDWPAKGVNFKDITTILENKKTFRFIVDKMAEPYISLNVDKVVAIDARGFLLAGPVAYKLGCGVCLIRKKGKLPFATIEEDYQKEYGVDTLAIHKDTVKPNERILIVDDVLATGGTIEAALKLVKRLGGKIVGASFIINLPYLGGSKRISKYKTSYLVSYDSE